MSAFLTGPGQSVRESFCVVKSLSAIAAVCVFSASAAFADEPAKMTATEPSHSINAKSSENWTIEIVPGPAIGPSLVAPVELTARKKANAEPKDAKETKPQKPAPADEPNPQVVTADATADAPRTVNPADYFEVYNSIPFSRTEYRANPNYRHEATMEILFGQMRSKVIVQFAGPLTQSTINNITPLGLYYDSRNLPARGMWRP